MAKYNKTLSKRLQRNKGKHVFYFHSAACLLKDHSRLINTVRTVPLCGFLSGFQLKLELFQAEEETYLFKIVRWLRLPTSLVKTWLRISREKSLLCPNYQQMQCFLRSISGGLRRLVQVVLPGFGRQAFLRTHLCVGVAAPGCLPSCPPLVTTRGLTDFPGFPRAKGETYFLNITGKSWKLSFFSFWGRFPGTTQHYLVDLCENVSGMPGQRPRG